MLAGLFERVVYAQAEPFGKIEQLCPYAGMCQVVAHVTWFLVEFLDSPIHKVEKVVLMLGRAMRCPKTLRFRDFCNVSPRSARAIARCHQHTARGFFA